MKKLFLLMICSAGFSLFAQKKTKVLLVIADGIPADVIERLQPPHLMAIAKKGFYSRLFVGGNPGTYSETPTISAPGYMNMLTGTWAYKHNVWDNENQQPNRSYPTIFRAYKSAVPGGNVALFSTWQDNRTVLIGDGLPATGNLHLDEVYDGFEKDTLQFPHDSASLYLHNIDDHVVHAADSVIRSKAPDLSWIYLEYTDDVGHSKGTGAAFDSAIMLLDRQIDKIDQAIRFREREKSEEWLLMITTDHGRDSITGAEHGDQSARERNTWIVSNIDRRNSYARKTTPAIVDIFPTAARFLQIDLPVSLRRELDGVALSGPVAVAQPQLQSKGDSLMLSWHSFSPQGSVKISITYTDNNRQGGKDEYKLIGTVPVAANQFSRVVPGLKQRKFYKVVLETESNTVNVWHLDPQRKDRP